MLDTPVRCRPRGADSNMARIWVASTEFPPEHHELAVVGEKIQASVDVVGVECQRVAGQQVADRTVVIAAILSHW